MPCYQVRTVSVSFQVGNIDLLKKALDLMKIHYSDYGATIVTDRFSIDLNSGQLSSTRINQIDLSKLTNQIKRAYSECVIDEVAKKQRWMKKQLGPNQFQLQRF